MSKTTPPPLATPAAPEKPTPGADVALALVDQYRTTAAAVTMAKAKHLATQQAEETARLALAKAAEEFRLVEVKLLHFLGRPSQEVKLP